MAAMTKPEMETMLADIRANMGRLQGQIKTAQGRDAAILRRMLRADQKSINLLRAGLAQ